MKLNTLTAFNLTACIALATASFVSGNGPAPERPNLSAIIEDFRGAQEELVQERRELAQSLRDKTAEQRREAVEAFQAANADRIALHRALSEEIREAMISQKPGAERPERPERPDGQAAPERPEVSSPVQALMTEFRTARDTLLQERLDLLARMRQATEEERAQALAELREQNAATVEQQREAAHQIRDAIQELRENRRND